MCTWKVQTLKRTWYAELLSLELDRYNITLSGLCESRWPDSGEISFGSFTYIWKRPPGCNAASKYLSQLEAHQ